MIRRIEFLKARGGGLRPGHQRTGRDHRGAQGSQALERRRELLQAFDFDDPGQGMLTGIAFLIVCDMLLTGFDAPVEQVMYIDKRLREHNLLQAIARVNRVAEDKHRGFIVDYIGLANHLTYALSIYAEEDAEDIQEGLKSILSELPILEERYQRLLQHSVERRARDRGLRHSGSRCRRSRVAVVHAAVGALKDIKRRADFEVYLKKFLQSLNLILPNAAGPPYRVPARRFGYLLRMVKERYKDDSLDITDAGEKVKALINEHLIDLGINPKIPPVELCPTISSQHVQKHRRETPRPKRARWSTPSASTARSTSTRTRPSTNG